MSSEQQDSVSNSSISKIVPLQKPEQPPSRPTPPPGTPDWERRAEEMMERAAERALARQNALLQQNVEQQVAEATQSLRTSASELASLVGSLRDEREQFRGTAERLIAQAEEVQMGNLEANAIMFDSTVHGETPQLANVEVGCMELAYPLFSADIARELDIAVSMVGKFAHAAGIWEDPAFHALVKASARTTNSRYKPRAVEKFRHFVDHPASYGIDESTPAWSLIRHYRKRAALRLAKR